MLCSALGWDSINSLKISHRWKERACDTMCWQRHVAVCTLHWPLVKLGTHLRPTRLPHIRAFSPPLLKKVICCVKGHLCSVWSALSIGAEFSVLPRESSSNGFNKPVWCQKDRKTAEKKAWDRKHFKIFLFIYFFCHCCFGDHTFIFPQIVTI